MRVKKQEARSKKQEARGKEQSKDKYPASCILHPVSRIGILGGSFDPPHYGHLALAETARVQLNLDCVLFVPAGQPPHKYNHTLSSPEHRAAMVAAAISDNPVFALNRVDLDRPGPHYTADMLVLLRTQKHSQKLDAIDWFFLMGEDALHDLPTWYKPDVILEHTTLAVMPRAGKRANLDALTQALPQLSTRITWLDVPPLDFSATDLRRRVYEGLPLRYLVPPEVETYIREHQLYLHVGDRAHDR